MTFLPIVERELRVGARRASTYWTRFYTALGVLVILVILLGSARSMAQPQLSQQLFVAMGVVSLGFALLAGVFLTADCLSEEQREGTLGLLFLTDLKGYDVVLGKLVATSVHALYGLLAVCPLMGLPLLLGGVTGGEVCRVVLVLLVTLFLSLALGMLTSALYREARQSMSAAFLGMLAVSGLLPALWWLQVVLVKSGWTPLLLWPSPAYAYRAAFDLFYRLRSGPPEFWGAVLVIGALGSAFLAAAALRLPRAWQRTEPIADARTKEPALARAAEFSPEPRGLSRPGTLTENPFAWLTQASSARFRLPWGLIVVLTTLGALFFFAAVNGNPRWREAVIICFFTHYALHQLFKYLVAVEASRQLSQDKQSGALELLLVTPLPETAILSGLVATLHQRFRGLKYLLIGVNLSMALAMVLFSQPLHMGGTDLNIFLELYFGGLVMLFLDQHTLIKVGMWMALRANKHNRAVLGTLGRVLLPPWICILLMVFLLSNFRGGAGTVGAIFGCWFGVGIMTDLVLLASATSGLERGFRYYLAGGCRRVDLQRP